MTSPTIYTASDSSSTVCLDAMGVRVRYGGRSHMWIERLLEGDPTFPRPFMTRNKRYWRIAELMAWEETKRQVANATA